MKKRRGMVDIKRRGRRRKGEKEEEEECKENQERGGWDKREEEEGRWLVLPVCLFRPPGLTFQTPGLIRPAIWLSLGYLEKTGRC